MPDLDALSREELVALVVQLYAQVVALQAEVERLRPGPPPSGGAPGTALSSAKSVPAWVKPNRPKPNSPKVRKKRSCAFVRPADQATATVQHAADQCPDCGRALQGGTIKRKRTIIDIPFVPAQVTEHQIVARWCGVCHKSVLPKVNLCADVLGKSRIGIRTMSLVAYLKTVCRMPVDTICAFLETHHNLHLSAGEIVDILRRVAKAGATEMKGLLEQLRREPFVHADETGWREDGQNGYIWSFSTPGIRYFVRKATRSNEVPKEVLKDFAGVLISDFYGGYSYYPGEHQRCWVHFLRDLKGLREKHSDSKSVLTFETAIRGLYDDAREYQHDRPKQRRQKRFAFQRKACALARRFIERPGPEIQLAKRLERFASELFTCVEYPNVAPDNNAAERAVRPAVIARKVSGGTRSETGSTTAAALMTLFGTWSARGHDLLHECQLMLAANAPRAHDQAG